MDESDILQAECWPSHDRGLAPERTNTVAEKPMSASPKSGKQQNGPTTQVLPEVVTVNVNLDCCALLPSNSRLVLISLHALSPILSLSDNHQHHRLYTSIAYTSIPSLLSSDIIPALLSGCETVGKVAREGEKDKTSTSGPLGSHASTKHQPFLLAVDSFVFRTPLDPACVLCPSL